MAKIVDQQSAYNAAAKVNEDARARYLQIGNQGLDAAHKRQALAQVYVAARAKMGAISEELAQSREQGQTNAEADLFGIPGSMPSSAVDRAALAGNMRDALGRASDCDSPEELVDVLRQWTTVGDEIGQRAAAAVAFQRMRSFFGGVDGQNWGLVIDEYAETHPDDASRIAELINPLGTKNSIEARLGLSMALSVAKPVEFSTVAEWQIEQFAQGA